ncbi:PIG-L family deacetylase [Bacillus clarus]|uniref:GlcNAc-PI de-N-acetylase family protein n=1 Tax=Bacillus clarus TaxID=2338372 RepID=A0A090YUX8_9BACI|nr:PIG-L deacetylase family protein [Bacillus clarus]KFN01773.1 glcNAc-PI de-N-acetylase family protein [Bacillus clarus]RFT66468.1 PIG-L family deacetylase [Bacillus clarus]
MAESILVIGAHPDDELLGAGGTLRRLIEEGYRVVSIITALGRREEAYRMQQISKAANSEIGIEEVIFLNHANLELELIPLHQFTKEIEQLIELYKPSKIFTHHYGDINIDHQITFKAVLTATRPLPNKQPIELITFETVSSSEWNVHTNDTVFKPNYYVNITNQMEEKIEALKHYDVEMRDFPHPRSYKGIRYLGRNRGMTIGVEYAEAFEVIRKVWR